MNWMVPAHRLDEHQQTVLRECGRAKEGDHHWIRGFAGTGKTVLLVHLAERILAENADARVCVAVYTHALRELIATGLPATCSTVPVMTYHQLLYRRQPYDWILLDEVQDIPAAKLREIKTLAGRVIAAGDMNQALYDHHPTDRQIRECLGRPTEHELNVLYRLTQGVRDIAATILPASPIHGAPTGRMQEVQVTLAHAESAEREEAWLWHELVKRSRAGSPAVVLLSKHEDIRRFIRRACRLEGKAEPQFDGTGEKNYDPVNEALERDGLPLQYLGNGRGELRASDNRKLAYVMTYHSAKGLDFETVFLPKLTRYHSFWGGDDAVGRRLLFVGVTRSRRNLFLSYFGDQPHPYVEAMPRDRMLCMECEPPATGPRHQRPPKDYF